MDKPEVGCYLIAEPFLGDPNFERSVILIVSHDEEGTVGLNLNKKTSYTMREALVNFPKIEVPLYEGGPVMNDNLFFLHNRPDLVKNGVLVNKNLYWGGDYNSLFQAIEQEYIQRNEYRFFSGYAGWGAGQLMGEVQDKSWIIVSNEGYDVLNYQVQNIWSDLIKSLGGDYPLWAQAPKNPDWN